MKKKIVLMVLCIICWDSFLSFAKYLPDPVLDCYLEESGCIYQENIISYCDAKNFIGPILTCVEDLNLAYPPPPSNDLCTGATELGVVGCSSDFTYFESPEATPDVEASGICLDNTTPGQWYTFSTPNLLPYSVISFNFGGVIYEIFKTDSDCSALEYVDCGEGIFYFVPEPATTYYILTAYGFGLFTQGVNSTSCSSGAIALNFGSANPYDFFSFTDCSQPSSIVPCENDYVRWYEYTSGCSLSDLYIEVSDYSGNFNPHALQVSISVFLNDCATLASEYDVNGLGYVCNGLDGETITLENIPPGTTLLIAHGSEQENIGYYDAYILETANNEIVENDHCVNAESVFEGLNEGLTNLCSTYAGGAAESGIYDCPSQFDATVWYEYDPGGELQDITINVVSSGINSPSIGVYESCDPVDLGVNGCTGTVSLLCIDYPIQIQIGSGTADGGSFDLDISTSPSGYLVESTISGDDICSNTSANIMIDIPNGEIVDMEVTVSPSTSLFISGMTDQEFSSVSNATINDILVNSSTLPQVVTYIISINPLVSNCNTETIEYSITVYPDFTSNNVMVDECLPHTLEVDVDDIVQGGSPPFASVSWYWNISELIGSGNQLSYELSESGEITVEIVDQYGCEGSILINVEISEPTTQTFDFPLEYCRSDQDIIYFSTTSLELINGSWNPPEFNLDNTSDGTHQIIFTPTEQASCNSPTSLTIDIYSGIIPEFDLPTLICSDAEEFVFPTLDENGVVGYWDYPSFDPSNGSGTYNNIFTPDTEDCASVFDYQFEVSSSLELTFNQTDSLCQSDEPITLNEVSEEGYIGSWDTPIVDPSTVSGDSIVLVWTPSEGQSDCIDEISITIQIIEPTIPDFSLPEELCSNDTLFTFPTFDNLEITGSWTVPWIDPSTSTGTVQSTFTSSDNCTEVFIWEISIIEPIIPTFFLDTSICALDSVIILPIISENGILGTWSQPTIDPMTVTNEELSLTFIGESTDTCVESIEVIFHIKEAIAPDFDLPEIVCWLDSDLSLPTNSLNGIEGSWAPEMIDVQANLGEVVTSIFTPSEGSCAESSSHSISIIAPYAIDVSILDPSGCMVEDGSISIDAGQLLNMEYSIDGGITWQSTSDFNGLSSGGYMVLIRSADLSDCILEREAFLNAADGPILNELQSHDINNCISDDGRIIVDADGDDLEYSIDGGSTWQVSNVFNNLAAGQYVISIKETMSDCIVEADATIEDIVQTTVEMIITQDISDCNADDGQIEIIANGESLEYSIDNGATWSTQNLFENLPPGNYDIIIQSTVGEDCIVNSYVVLDAPNMPEIIDVFVQSPTICDVDIGTIEVEAVGDNLEYSFDGGVTWQNANMVSNISVGIYTVIVRDADRIQCYVEEDVTILAEEESLAESEFTITLPTDCELSDGILSISNFEIDLEYSIDAGIIWQPTNVFNNLPSGIYNVLTRKIVLPECFVEQSVEIPDVDCECLDLIIDFTIENITCDDEDSAIIELTSIQGPVDSDIEIIWQNGTVGKELIEVGEGWHVFTINYDEQCIWKDSIFVELLLPISFEVIIQHNECPDLNTGEIDIINVTGGNNNYQYSIDGGVTFQQEHLFTNLAAGIFDIIIQDDANCISMQSIEVESPEIIEIQLPDIESITIGESIILNPNINATTIDSFSWTPIDGIVNLGELIVEVKPLHTTTYRLEIFYDNCYDSKTITIIVEDLAVELESEIILSNIFSPNGDNFNDVFYIQGNPGSQILVNSLSIFDRWGGLLFYKSNPKINEATDGWDGNSNGRKVNSGVYVYMISYMANGKEMVNMGTVTVVY